MPERTCRFMSLARASSWATRAARRVRLGLQRPSFTAPPTAITASSWAGAAWGRPCTGCAPGGRAPPWPAPCQSRCRCPDPWGPGPGRWPAARRAPAAAPRRTVKQAAAGEVCWGSARARAAGKQPKGAHAAVRQLPQQGACTSALVHLGNADQTMPATAATAGVDMLVPDLYLPGVVSGGSFRTQSGSLQHHDAAPRRHAWAAHP
jgi:hypothetical protein